MIFVDSDLFLIDLRYSRDRRFSQNRAFLEKLKRSGQGMTTIFNLLEICGVLSFNLNRRQLWELFHYFEQHYGVQILPSATSNRLPSFTVRELMGMIERRAALGDALILALLQRQVRGISPIVSWNAAHFEGRIGIPALRPPEAMKQF